MSARRLSLLLALALVAVAASGCTSLEKRLAPERKVVTQKAIVASSKATIEGTAVAGLPGDIPLWPGSEVVATKNHKESYDLTLRTADGYDEVLAGLAAGFEDEGWEVMQDESAEEGVKSAILTVAKDDSQGIITVADSVAVTGTVDIAYVLVK